MYHCGVHVRWEITSAWWILAVNRGGRAETQSWGAWGAASGISNPKPQWGTDTNLACHKEEMRLRTVTACTHSPHGACMWTLQSGSSHWAASPLQGCPGTRPDCGWAVDPSPAGQALLWGASPLSPHQASPIQGAEPAAPACPLPETLPRGSHPRFPIQDIQGQVWRQDHSNHGWPPWAGAAGRPSGRGHVPTARIR